METKITSLIVDDELNVAENLAGILRDFCPNIEVVKISTTISEAKKDIAIVQPKLVFLDIQIGTRMIFEMLESIEIDFEIIFISAHNYALDAFKFMAIDYLLKPVDIKSLVKAVDRAIFNKKNRLFSKHFEELLTIVKKDDSTLHKIAIPNTNGYQMIRISDILYCLAEGSYTLIYLVNKNHLVVSKNLKFYEDLLTRYNFIRIHNSSLVNSAYIKEISKSEGGFVMMDDGKILSMSKSRREETFNKLHLK
ncbi:LytTR family DNA-binding domain-containing protein [uncultured Aquimarina sp.]|uniref:LytR/AlgR family response regulator transcription factor n=1 Tax=uncultured Aquimarina sp. TaxID=575652 RepID=UPI0026080804|nr:LytTR family DNA-binding domain-containing protein [uncultured Aquimarina sp.]